MSRRAVTASDCLVTGDDEWRASLVDLRAFHSFYLLFLDFLKDISASCRQLRPSSRPLVSRLHGTVLVGELSTVRGMYSVKKSSLVGEEPTPIQKQIWWGPVTCVA